MYRKDFFKFAKKACNGTLDSMDVAPTFTKQQADDFYSSRYSTLIEIDRANLSWFPSVEEAQVPYDTSSVSPGMLKTIFKSKSATSAPGEDGVMSSTVCWTRCPPPTTSLPHFITVWIGVEKLLTSGQTALLLLLTKVVRLGKHQISE